MFVDLPTGYEAKSKNGRYIVKTPDGETIKASCLFGAAEICDRLDYQSRLKQRTCLSWGCDTEFMSEGSHHRMCDKCRGNKNDQGMVR